MYIRIILFVCTYFLFTLCGSFKHNPLNGRRTEQAISDRLKVRCDPRDGI